MARKPTDPRLSAASDRLVAEDVVKLIADARKEARKRVRAELVDVLTDAMLEQAYRELGESAPAEPDRAPAKPDRAPAKPHNTPAEPQRPPATGTGVYIYCVVPADTELPAGLPSIDPAHSPTLLRHDRLAAVVSQVPLEDFGEERLRERLADLEWLERTARAHEQVLEMVGREATLIPMRLCSVYRSEDGVTKMLAQEAKALEEALAHLEGKTEWGVKVFANPVAPPSGTNPTGKDAETNDSGTDYMRRRRTDRDRRRNADQELHDACVAIHERLAADVADALTSPPQRPEVSGHPGQMLLNGVYLVEDDQMAAFQALVDELQAHYEDDGLELLPTGPWPAYNFVPGTIGAAW
jgi:Gas vesicle synthesis protein GvpL/GvpF